MSRSDPSITGFQSKEELLRAVHRQLMEDLHHEQTAMVDAVRAEAKDLPSLLAMLIDRYGGVF